MHPFHVPQYTFQDRNVHISVLNGAFGDMEQAHCGICEFGQFCFGVSGDIIFFKCGVYTGALLLFIFLWLELKFKL